VQNSKLTSPQLNDLDQMAGPSNSSSVSESTPGAVASAKSSIGPQYLFGGEILHIKLRIDMIEWKGAAAADAASPAGKNRKTAPTTGNNSAAPGVNP